MFEFDDKQILKMEKDLEKLSRVALPIATGRTLADTAMIARRFARQDLEQKFTLRSKYVLNSVIFDNKDSRNRDINKQSASVGSTFDGLRVQEFGETIRAKGKEGVPVPTGTASNEGDRPIPKTKLPSAANRRKNIKIRRGSKKALGRRRGNVVLIKEAAEAGDRFVYLETDKSKGIYRLLGSRKKPRLKMVWDLSKKTRRIPPKPWLVPASEDALEIQSSLYAKHLADQIKRNNLFRPR